MSAKGNEMLLRGRTQFRSLRTVETLRKIDVPEFGGEVHYWPEMSVDEKRAIFACLRMVGGDIETTPGNLLEASIVQVCRRSRDAFGDRLFSDDQEEDIRDLHPDVIQRIANEMGWGGRTTIEEAEKN
jgi:hypothetical protein